MILHIDGKTYLQSLKMPFLHSFSRNTARMRQTMQKMEKMNESEHTPFMRVLFGDLTPSPPAYDALGSIDFIDQRVLAECVGTYRFSS